MRERLEPLLVDPDLGDSEAELRIRRALDRSSNSAVTSLVTGRGVPTRLRVAASHAILERVGEARIASDALANGRHADGWRRIVALRVLADTRPDLALVRLKDALATGGPSVVRMAASILREIGDRTAAVLLVRALHDGRWSRARLAMLIEDYPIDVADALIGMMRSDEPAVRYWGARLLRRYPRVPGLREHLVVGARDPDPLVRRASLETLAVVGGSSAAGIAREALRDETPYVRAYAARALAALQGPAGAGAILPLLADRDWWVRYAVKQSLETLGPEVATDVAPYLTHEDAFARNGAAEVLQNIGAFEWVLVRAAREWPGPDRLDVLRRLAEAGGAPMWGSVLDRLDSAGRARARELLAVIHRAAS